MLSNLALGELTHALGDCDNQLNLEVTAVPLQSLSILYSLTIVAATATATTTPATAVTVMLTLFLPSLTHLDVRAAVTRDARKRTSSWKHKELLLHLGFLHP